MELSINFQKSCSIWWKSELRSRWLAIDQRKKKSTVCAVSSATNDREEKVIEAQTMLSRYGTSCFLQLLDDEPENRVQKGRKEWIF